MDAVIELHWFWAFAALYWANLVLDYPWQSNFEAANKGKSWYVMWVHCSIWSGGLAIGLALLGKFAVWKLVFLLVGHFLMDSWKARGWYEGRGGDGISAGGFGFFRGNRSGLSDYTAYFIDQGFHVLQLVIVFVEW